MKYSIFIIKIIAFFNSCALACDYFGAQTEVSQIKNVVYSITEPCLRYRNAAGEFSECERIYKPIERSKSSKSSFLQRTLVEGFLDKLPDCESDVPRSSRNVPDCPIVKTCLEILPHRQVGRIYPSTWVIFFQGTREDQDKVLDGPRTYASSLKEEDPGFLEVLRCLMTFGQPADQMYAMIRRKNALSKIPQPIDAALSLLQYPDNNIETSQWGLKILRKVIQSTSRSRRFEVEESLLAWCRDPLIREEALESMVRKFTPLISRHPLELEDLKAAFCVCLLNDSRNNTLEKSYALGEAEAILLEACQNWHSKFSEEIIRLLLSTGKQSTCDKIEVFINKLLDASEVPYKIKQNYAALLKEASYYPKNQKDALYENGSEELDIPSRVLTQGFLEFRRRIEEPKFYTISSVEFSLSFFRTCDKKENP